MKTFESIAKVDGVFSVEVANVGSSEGATKGWQNRERSKKAYEQSKRAHSFSFDAGDKPSKINSHYAYAEHKAAMQEHLHAAQSYLGDEDNQEASNKAMEHFEKAKHHFNQADFHLQQEKFNKK